MLPFSPLSLAPGLPLLRVLFVRAPMAALPAPGGRPETSPAYPLPRKGNGSSHVGISRPSWIVKTESNVPKVVMKRPNPPCIRCRGTGRLDCHNCQGKGRTNFAHLAMLPKGEWPKWCKTCRGSGLEYCSRCLGTGEYRDIMGFHFMKVNNN